MNRLIMNAILVGLLISKGAFGSSESKALVKKNLEVAVFNVAKKLQFNCQGCCYYSLWSSMHCKYQDCQVSKPISDKLNSLTTSIEMIQDLESVKEVYDCCNCQYNLLCLGQIQQGKIDDSNTCLLLTFFNTMIQIIEENSLGYSLRSSYISSNKGVPIDLFGRFQQSCEYRILKSRLEDLLGEVPNKAVIERQIIQPPIGPEELLLQHGWSPCLLETENSIIQTQISKQTGNQFFSTLEIIVDSKNNKEVFEASGESEFLANEAAAKEANNYLANKYSNLTTPTASSTTGRWWRDRCGRLGRCATRCSRT